MDAQPPGALAGWGVGWDSDPHDTTREPVEFGLDVLDVIEDGFRACVHRHFGFDVIDVLNEGLDIPMLCTECNEAWLMGPEALASGKCWRCRMESL